MLAFKLGEREVLGKWRGGIKVDLNRQDYSMLQGKQSAWIISVYCLLHKVLYGFTSQFTEQASFLVHLYWFPNSLTCSINFIHQPSRAFRKRREEELFSLPLRMLCDFDLVTYMIDSPWTVKMIASLMKGPPSQSWHLKCWCPWTDH